MSASQPQQNSRNQPYPPNTAAKGNRPGRKRQPQKQAPADYLAFAITDLKTALRGISILSFALHNAKVVYIWRQTVLGRRPDDILTPINMSCFIARLYSLVRAREAILDLACEGEYVASVDALDEVVFPFIQALLGAGNNATVDQEATRAAKKQGREDVHVLELSSSDVPADHFLALFCLDGFEVVLEGSEYVYGLEEFRDLIEEHGAESEVMLNLGKAVVGRKIKGSEEPKWAMWVDKMVEGVNAVELGGWK